MTVVMVQVESAVTGTDIPASKEIDHWVSTALQAIGRVGSVSVKIADEAEAARINHQYRDRDYATNVLSFPADLPDAVAREMCDSGQIPPLGDLLLCAPVIREEARQQGKVLINHWAHLLVHGVLHLCGFNHETEAEAEVMEQKEVAILAGFGISDPYIQT